MLLQVLFFITIFGLLCILVKQAREQYLPVIAFAVLVAFLPLNETFNILGMLIMSMLIVVFFVFNKSRQFTWHSVFYAIAAMYLLKIVGVINVGYLDFPTQRFDTAIPLILFPVLFSMVQLSKKNVLQLLRFFVWIVIVVCIYGILSYTSAVSEISWKTVLLEGKRYARFFTVDPITWQPSALSITLLMALPVSFYLRYHNDGKQITLVEMLLAIILPILVTFMVGARVGVAIFPMLLVLSYLFYSKFRPIFKWGLVVVGVIAMSTTFLLLPPDVKKRYTDPIRIDLRNTAISAIKEKPIFGWGTWQQRDLITCEKRAESLGIARPRSQWHFHNLYLDIMVQYGIFGLTVLLWFLLWTLWIAVRNKHFLLLSFMMIYLIAFYFEIVLYSSRWVVTFMFWFCFLIANYKYLSERTS